MPDERTRNPLPPAWHVARLRVPLFEVDLGQAVYHGNVLHLFELAREEFLRELQYPYRRFMEEETHLAVVELSCSYRRPLRYDDLIQVHTAVPQWRTRSLVFSQAIFREEGNGKSSLCTQARLHMVCIRFSGRPTVLPPEFVERLKRHPLASR
ncbi:MAG: acyl-CoA thioesterase [Deltaproteobacteria bacterium]|nr:acyl-CoA thioesterase [Deltaproteobacteria bacterium]